MKTEIINILKKWENALVRYGKIDRWNLNEDIKLLNQFINELNKQSAKYKKYRTIRDYVLCQNQDNNALLSEIQKVLGNKSSAHIEKKKKIFHKHKRGQEVRYRNETERIFYEKLRFKDSMLLRNFDIEIQSPKDTRKVRRIVEKRMCQAYHKQNKNNNDIDSNRDKYWMKRATAFQLYNIGQIEVVASLKREKSSHWKKQYDSQTGKRVLKKKTAYKTEQDALAALKEWKLKYPTDKKEMHAYRCDTCNKWHIGHSSPYIMTAN